MSPVDPTQLDAAIAQIRKAYGDSAIIAGNEKSPLVRIPTGSIELDVATGGGIPMGRWAHAYGGFSSGKTLTSYNAIANAQEMGMTCAYYNIENQYDPIWAASRGVNVDDLLVVDKTAIEDVGGALETLLGSVNFHVLDSLAAAISIDELEAGLDDWRPGIAARAWGKVFRRTNERFDDKENAILMINQVRETFGYGGGESPPGGRFVEFMSSLSLHFRRSTWLYKDGKGNLSPDAKSGSSLSGDKEPDGIEFQVRVNKSRVGPPLRTARMRIDFESGLFDEMWNLTKAAKFYRIVEQKGSSSWYTLPSGDKVQGEAGIREALQNDPELMDRARKAMQLAK